MDGSLSLRGQSRTYYVKATRETTSDPITLLNTAENCLETYPEKAEEICTDVFAIKIFSIDIQLRAEKLLRQARINVSPSKAVEHIQNRPEGTQQIATALEEDAQRCLKEGGNPKHKTPNTNNKCPIQ